jgi:hypothetical protein
MIVFPLSHTILLRSLRAEGFMNKALTLETGTKLVIHIFTAIV